MVYLLVSRLCLRLDLRDIRRLTRVVANAPDRRHLGCRILTAYRRKF
jgi:hypothetical protein